MNLSVKKIHFGEHNGELKDQIEGQSEGLFHS